MAGDCENYLNHYLSYKFNKENSRESLDVLFTENNIESPYTKNDYISTSDFCIELFKKSKFLFEDYHDDIIHDILNVVKIVDYYRKDKEKILEYVCK